MENKIIMSTQRSRNLKWLIWLYFWLLIFEGAIRKWVFPQLAAPLLIIRDPIAIGAYFLAIQQGIFPKDQFTKIIIFIAFISSLASLATVINFDRNLAVTLFGIRTNFLHLPLIFLVSKVFNLEDVKQLGKWVLLLAVPMAMLMVFQFNSPPDAFINRTAGVGEGLQISSALGKIRTPGTFSYVTGAGQYLSLVAAFLLYGLFQKKLYSNWLLFAAGISLVVALAVSGSRLAVGSVGLVLLSLIVVLLVKPALVGKSYKLLALLGAVGFAISFIPSFNDGIEVLSSRAEAANATEAKTGGIVMRFFTGFLEPFDRIDEIPLFGHGLGMGTNVGAALLTGKVQFMLAEGEWQRIVFESGPVLGLIYILLRIALAGWMGWFCIKNAIAGNILPLLLFGTCALLILNGQFSRSSDIGFAVLGGGLCLASAKSSQIYV